MFIGDRLKELRTARKMSQKDLAEQIGIAKSVISFYESDARCPSYDVLIKIAEIFNMNEVELRAKLGIGFDGMEEGMREEHDSYTE